MKETRCWAALEKEHGPMPLTWRFLRAAAGTYFCSGIRGDVILNSAGHIGKGIDVRGDGTFAAPPSMKAVAAYAISVDHDPETVSLADAPDWLLSLSAPCPRRIKHPILSRRRICVSGFSAWQKKAGATT